MFIIPAVVVAERQQAFIPWNIYHFISLILSFQSVYFLCDFCSSADLSASVSIIWIERIKGGDLPAWEIDNILSMMHAVIFPGHLIPILDVRWSLCCYIEMTYQVIELLTLLMLSRDAYCGLLMVTKHWNLQLLLIRLKKVETNNLVICICSCLQMCVLCQYGFQCA